MALGEATRVFATSKNVAGRLERSTGLVAEVLPHPAQELPYHDDGPGDFVLSVNRLDRAKRVDMLLGAAAASRPAGRDRRRRPGPRRLEQLAHERGLDGRVRFAGRVSAGELADLYATCYATFYAPVDEDFGLGPYESFLSGKPVITTTDAGGPLEVVHDGSTGGSSTRSRPPSPGRRHGCATTPSRRKPTAAPAKRSPARSRGIAPSRGCSRERSRPGA